MTPLDPRERTVCACAPGECHGVGLDRFGARCRRDAARAERDSAQARGSANGPAREGPFPAIRRVLAQYRSESGHITQEQITEAWAEYDALTRAARGVVEHVGHGDKWPVAISDGLGMPCSDCGAEPRFDYRVTEDFWRQHVPEKPARLSVVCLPCLDRRCGGTGLAEALVFVQWTGTGHTVELLPDRRFTYERGDDRAA